MPRLFVAIVILALSYYPVLYGITWWAKDGVITRLVEAVQAGKGEALESYIHWDKLRAYLKRDLKNKAASIRKAESVPGFGPKPEEMAELVAHYATPKGIEMALAIKKQLYPDTSPRAFIADRSIEGPSSFSVTLALPEKIKRKGDLQLSKKKHPPKGKFLRVRLVFERQGWHLHWRATQMHVPVFLVPPEIYTLEQVKQKLKNQSGPK